MMSPVRPTLLLLPTPRFVDWTDGVWTRPAALTVFIAGSRDPITDPTLLRELDGARQVPEPREAAVRCLSADAAPARLRRWAQQPEGYALSIGPGGIDLWAATARGRLYGALTLRQLLRQFGRRLPGLVLGDAPMLAHRGTQLSLVQGHTAFRPSLARHIAVELARWKINTLYFYLESYFDFPSLPNTAGPGAMTADEARELDRHCRAYGITPVPVLNVMGHSSEILSLQRYRSLGEYRADTDPRLQNGFNLCATSPAVRRFVDAMLNDMFDAFSGEIIHVGGDEVSLLGECPHCRRVAGGRSKLELYLAYFSRIRDVARRRGRHIGIWGDMLLHYIRPLPTRQRERLLAPLRSGVWVYDWHYTGGSPDTLKFFVDAGLTTVACSSSNLCYLSSLWPAQEHAQRELFADAVRAGAHGGMTTSWCNFTGLHEEQLNYLFATGGTALWSDPAQGASADVERAYALQRYGLRSGTFMRYAHTLGDAAGPVLSPLAPYHGVNLRKSLYHTDNVFTFWRQYADLLRGPRLRTYRAGVAQARRLWDRTRSEIGRGADRWFPLHEAPLIMHEHLLRRFDMIERFYTLYDAAAHAQFTQPARFRQQVRAAVQTLRGHLADFPPVERYLRNAQRLLGLDQSSIVRVQATKRGIRELADFLEHLAGSDRPLPAFGKLESYFFREMRTNWYGDREHEWSRGPARFRRYTLESGPWPTGPELAREPGPRVLVHRFLLSRLMPLEGRIDQLALPRHRAAMQLQRRTFPTAYAHVHNDLFPNGESGVVWFIARVRCAESMRLEIGLGYDGPIKLWVDGVERFCDPAGINPAYADKARVPWRATRGTHELALAFSSNSGRAYGIQVLLHRMDVRPGARSAPRLPEVVT